jgi:hypothetical protein
MGVTGGPLRELIADAIDDERIYRANVGADSTVGGLEPSADVLEDELRTAAERLERTVGCVTTVVRTERGRVGPADYYNITLFAILPRHTDKDLFDRVAEDARIRALERAHDRERGEK